MLLAEAMRLIDEQVAGGAAITITNDPPLVLSTTAGRRTFPEMWTARLGPIPAGDVEANPQCSAYSMEQAIIGVGEFIARQASA